MIFKHILLIMLLNLKPKLILLHTVKWSKAFLCITNNLIKHQSFVYTQLNDETVLFLTIQFSISNLMHTDEMSNSSILPNDRNLSGATTMGLSGPGSNGNEEVLSISLSFSSTVVSPSDCLVLDPGHSL